MEKSFESLIEEFLDFSIITFDKATASSSIKKLEEEIGELKYDVTRGHVIDSTKEYVDCICCIFDSARRFGLDLDDIKRGLAEKTEINKKRNWIRNTDNTYSHSNDI